MITPGVSFIARAFPKAFFLPASGTYAILYALDKYFDLSILFAAKWAVVLSAAPVYRLGVAFLKSIWHKRQAVAMGAVSVPIWQGKLPGNIDVLRTLMDTFETGYPAEPFWQMIWQLGNTINLRILWINSVFTCEPEHIKQILATEFTNFEKGPLFIFTSQSVLGTGVFNADGELWKFHRAMTRPFFSKERISHFDIFDRHADAAVSIMSQRLSEGFALDIQDLFMRFTFDSATEFLFAHCVHSLKAGLPYPQNALIVRPELALQGELRDDVTTSFVRAFSDAQFEISVRHRLGVIWPFWEIFRDRTKKSMDVVNAFLNPILTEALRKKRESFNDDFDKDQREKDIDGNETLLDHLVKMTDDHAMLRDEILNIMIAGRDTTGATLTFAVYFLCLHPDKMKRLRAEVLEKVGPSERPTYESIRAMKYLRAFINETLRLFPPVPFNLRASLKATTFPPTSPGGKPLYVPPQTNCAYSVFMMHRRTDLWGPDAMDFDPDRFLDERLHKYLTPNPFIFLPFNAGPRICLGQQFAYNETSFMLIKLLQKFESFELDSSAQPADSLPPPEWKNAFGRQSIERMFPKSHLTMYAHKGLWVRAQEASE